MVACELGFVVGPNFSARQHVFSSDSATFGVFDSVVRHLLFVPAVANAEDESAVRDQVERRTFFGQPQWISLGDQGYAGTKHQIFGYRGRGR